MRSMLISKFVGISWGVVTIMGILLLCSKCAPLPCTECYVVIGAPEIEHKRIGSRLDLRKWQREYKNKDVYLSDPSWRIFVKHKYPIPTTDSSIVLFDRLSAVELVKTYNCFVDVDTSWMIPIFQRIR